MGLEDLMNAYTWSVAFNEGWDQESFTIEFRARFVGGPPPRLGPEQSVCRSLSPRPLFADGWLVGAGLLALSPTLALLLS